MSDRIRTHWDGCWRSADHRECAVARIEEMEESIELGTVSDGYHTFHELYSFRRCFNALLFNEWASQGKYDVHKSQKHSDGTMFDGGYFIVVAQLPTGQISNHYKMKHWEEFKIPEREFAAQWDRHASTGSLERMEQMLLSREVVARPEAERDNWKTEAEENADLIVKAWEERDAVRAEVVRLREQDDPSRCPKCHCCMRCEQHLSWCDYVEDET